MDKEVEYLSLSELVEISRSREYRQEGEFTLREFVEESGLSESVCRRRLNKFIEQGLIEKRKGFSPDNGNVTAYYRALRNQPDKTNDND